MRRKQPSDGSGSAASSSRSLARSLDFECMRSASLPYGEVVGNFRKVEKFHLRELGKSAKLALETERRIAEHLLDQAIFHRCAQRVCNSRLKAAAKLGFTDIEREAHFRLLYARGALARGHRRIARKTATEMTEKLERSLKRRKSLLARQCLRLFQELLKYIESQS
jgi:hypothetical protein